MCILTRDAYAWIDAGSWVMDAAIHQERAIKSLRSETGNAIEKSRQHRGLF
jgi:hypothetical protein